MPVACITLEETNRTVLMASYFKVIEQVLLQTSIPYGTLIVMHKGVEINRTDNETNLTSKTLANLPSTVASRKAIVEITEDYNEDALGTTAVSYKDTTPIFIDNDIDLVVYPVYVSSNITLKISFTTPSKTEANRLRDDLRMKLSQMRNIGHHEIEYDILIPTVVQELIADTHELKSRLYPMELGEYFRTHSTKQIHMLTDMANKENALPAMRERQVRIVGQFDFNPMPEPVEENNDQNSYRLTIPYKFTMEVPRGMCMSYEPMVCNKPMPAKYLKWVQNEKVNTREEYARNLTYTSSMQALSHFESHRQLDYRIQNKLPLNLPLFDTFPLRQGHHGYMITTTFLTDVDEVDRKTLFNLKEIPDYYMDSKFLEFMQRGEKSHMVIPYRSMFYFGLHYGGRYFDHDCLEITDDLTVRSKVRLPLDKPVRIAFSVLGDPAFISKIILDRWYQDKDMLLLYVREYLRALNNYKHELRKIVEDDLTFQNLFIKLLIQALKDRDTELITSLFDQCKSENIVMENLVNLLRAKYPHIYRQLNQKVDLDKLVFHKTLAPENHAGLYPHLRRSVMNAYVQSYKQT